MSLHDSTNTSRSSLRTRSKRRGRGRGRLSALAATGVAVLLIAACSSSSHNAGTSSTTTGSSGTTASTASGTSAAVAEANSELATYNVVPTTVGVTAPLPQPASTLGKKSIIFMQNPTPDAQTIEQGAQAAAQLLGWSFKSIPYQETAPSEQGAFNQAIADHPDAILDSAAPADTLAPQRAQMAQDGISFITCCAAYPAGTPNPPLGLVEGANALGFNGQLNADWAVSKTNGHAHVLIVTIPAFTVLAPFVADEQSRLSELCAATCSSTVVTGQVTDIGTNFPGIIVSALQRDPSINYVSLTSGSLGLGLPAALAQAGLTSKVKIIGEAPVASNLTDLTNGTEEMEIATSDTITGWRLIDVYMRHLEGQTFPLQASTPTDHGPTSYIPPAILTKASGPFSANFNLPANYESIFKTLWGISS